MQSPATRNTRRRRALATVASGALLAGVGGIGLAATTADASSHREAPIISGMPQYDNTDVYAFVSPNAPKKTTLIANWIPFASAAGTGDQFPVPLLDG